MHPRIQHLNIEANIDRLDGKKRQQIIRDIDTLLVIISISPRQKNKNWSYIVDQIVLTNIYKIFFRKVLECTLFPKDVEHGL